MAHVIAWSPDGPRRDGERGLSESLDAVENLVLLCPNCHSLVDQVPDDFPVEMLIGWREERASRVRQVAAMSHFVACEELTAEIRRLLAASRAVHDTYGPESPAATDPISGAADTWRREAVRVILPNNRQVLELADANRELLKPDQLEAIERFRVHADGFAYNQLSGDKDESVPSYPMEMEVFEQ